MRAPAAAGQTGPNPRTQSCPAARPAAPPKRTNVPGQQGRLQDLGGGRGGGGRTGSNSTTPSFEK